LIPLIVMPTVRHTGTIFLQSKFESVGYERVTLRGELKPFSVVVEHLYDGNMRHFKSWLGEKNTIVIPLRDPQTTLKGWIKRGEIGDSVPNHSHFNHQWKNLIALDALNPIYIPIDTDDRQERLDALSERIGADLGSDWTPVNTSPLKAEDVPDVSYMYDWPVIRDFYGKS